MGLVFLASAESVTKVYVSWLEMMAVILEVIIRNCGSESVAK